MNVVIVSPQFPRTYWNFCDRLRRNGATVLGIGDTPEGEISPELHSALAEYYWVPDMERYDEMFRAVAYFSWKYGKIDWIESNNEHWLSTDAALRTDFHVTTGADSATMAAWQSKAAMKPLYAVSGIPTARQVPASSVREVRAFAREVGYPLFAKPETGVGSGGARELADDVAVDAFFAEGLDVPYVVEELVSGEICSYDAILDSAGHPLFENQSEFPPSMAAVASQQLDIAYWACPRLDRRLRDLGRATATGFGLARRFVHMEFFRLAKARVGLGEAGDYVGLEVNVRPPGGYTPDMMNYAHSTDVYQIWADMVTRDATDLVDGERFYCVHASRRDIYRYARTHEEVIARYGDALVMCERIPDGLADDLGNQMYVARLKTLRELRAFVRFVQERA